MTTPLRRRRRAIPLALAAAAAVISLSGCSTLSSFFGGSEPVRNDEGQVTEANENADVFSVRIGDCINLTSEASESFTVPIVPCDEPHDAEAYAAMDLEGENHPGDDAVMAEADAFCLDEFSTFIGMPYENSELLMNYFYPSEESWAQGDREILCLAYGLEGEKVTGTLANSQR